MNIAFTDYENKVPQKSIGKCLEKGSPSNLLEKRKFRHRQLRSKEHQKKVVGSLSF